MTRHQEIITLRLEEVGIDFTHVLFFLEITFY